LNTTNELSKLYELDGLRMQYEKMEASYLEILPKVCSNLVHDLLVRLKHDSEIPPLYTVEVFTKEGTDPQACKDHILATTGTVPGIYDHGTHYVTHMRLTLEILKKLNDFEFVLEVVGEYTDTEASLGPLHNIGEAHIARQAPVFKQEKPTTVKSKGKTSRPLIYVLVGVFIAISLGGFIVSGGLLPNVNKSRISVSSLQISDLGTISGKVTGPLGLPAMGSTIIVHKTSGLPGTDQALPDYTTNSIISIDGKYVFSLPPGVYRFTVAFPDGINHVVSNYAVWPGSIRSLDFKY
jgi:hypothetical protein